MKGYAGCPVRFDEPDAGQHAFMGVAIAVVLLVVMVVFAVLFGRTFRKGGAGPPIQIPAFTRAGRLRTNASYEKHGWSKPYDEDGKIIPRSQR